MAVKEEFNLSDMRFSGQLQNNTPVNDASGGQTDNYATILTTRCALEKKSGRVLNNGRLEFYKYYLLTCRFQKAIVINVDSQWLINGEVYKIQDWDKVDLIPFLYTFTVTKNQ